MFENPLVGEKAPDFSLKTVSGQEVNLTKFRNSQNTIIFFWATWCPHCREQLQELTSQRADEIRKKGIKLLLVDVEETPAEVSAYVKKYKIPFDVVVDEDSRVSEEYNIVGVPTFFFVDRQGIVQSVEHEISKDYEENFSAGVKK